MGEDFLLAKKEKKNRIKRFLDAANINVVGNTKLNGG